MEGLFHTYLSLVLLYLCLCIFIYLVKIHITIFVTHNVLQFLYGLWHQYSVNFVYIQHLWITSVNLMYVHYLWIPNVCSFTSRDTYTAITSSISHMMCIIIWQESYFIQALTPNQCNYVNIFIYIYLYYEYSLGGPYNTC